MLRRALPQQPAQFLCPCRSGPTYVDNTKLNTLSQDELEELVTKLFSARGTVVKKTQSFQEELYVATPPASTPASSAHWGAQGAVTRPRVPAPRASIALSKPCNATVSVYTAGLLSVTVELQCQRVTQKRNTRHLSSALASTNDPRVTMSIASLRFASSESTLDRGLRLGL